MWAVIIIRNNKYIRAILRSQHQFITIRPLLHHVLAREAAGNDCYEAGASKTNHGFDLDDLKLDVKPSPNPSPNPNPSPSPNPNPTPELRSLDAM